MDLPQLVPERTGTWLARGAQAWRKALEPLTGEQRKMFVETLRAYEEEAFTENW